MHGSAANPKYDIVDTAISEASFTRFLSAIKSVQHMVDHLKGAGPFTVFMPTDQAFKKLPEGTIQELEKPTNAEKLENIVRYHIVVGAHSSTEVQTMQTILTESGNKLAVESDGRGIKINNALVVGRDIRCTNGIIHAVDSLLFGF